MEVYALWGEAHGNSNECAAFSYGHGTLGTKYSGHPLTDVAYWEESVPVFEQHWNEKHLGQVF
jgi:hypothetical protein